LDSRALLSPSLAAFVEARAEDDSATALMDLCVAYANSKAVKKSDVHHRNHHEVIYCIKEGAIIMVYVE
jgi:hypothetical protein